MNVMHLLASAGTGGIEGLCRDYSRYSCNNNIFVALWNKNGDSASAIINEQGIAIELDLSKKQVLTTIKKLSKLIDEYSVDTIVTHHASPILHTYMHLLRIKKSTIKTIAYAHGAAKDMYRHNDPKGLFIRKKVLSYSMNKSDRVVAISKSVKKSLVEDLNISSDKITIVYNGADIQKYVCNIQRVKTGSNRLIYVGRLIKEKGVQITINALSKLPATLDWTFDIVGDGECRKQLENFAQRLRVGNRINFLGNRKDVAALLKQHDIFIHMPVWEEGFGITVIEAMAAGLLCICKTSGGIPEIIDAGVNGILVQDQYELTKTLTSILSHDKKYSISTIRKNAIKKARVFDIKEYSRRLDGIINNL